MTQTIEAPADTRRVTQEPNHPADLALVRAAIAQDPRALDELTERFKYIPRLLSAINARRGRVLDEHEIADLVQDTITLAWTKLGSYAGTAALKTWLHRFAENVLSNAIRKKLRRAAVLIPDACDRVEATADRIGEPLSHEEIHVAVDRLKASQAEVIRLKYFEGLTFQEIAVRFKMPVDSVKTRYYRGLVSLRGWLGPRIKKPKT